MATKHPQLMFTILFLTPSGREVSQTTDTPNDLAEATIYGSNIAEENGWELVGVSECYHGAKASF